MESVPAQGSTFWFTVCLHEAQRPADGVAVARTLECVRPLRILVAEDNEANQLVAVSLLQKAGHTVVVAANGADTVAACERESFDAVLMDLQMPGMDGFQATQEIRRREPAGRHTRIVGLTAHAGRGVRDRCLAAGMDAYLAKPFHRHELEQVIAGVARMEWQAGTTSGDTCAAPGLDPKVILARLEGDEQLLHDLIDVYRRELPQRLTALRQAIQKGDGQAAAFQAHRLLGLARQFDAREAIAVAENLESTATAGKLAALNECYDDAEGHFLRLEQALGAL